MLLIPDAALAPHSSHPVMMSSAAPSGVEALPFSSRNTARCRVSSGHPNYSARLAATAASRAMASLCEPSLWFCRKASATPGGPAILADGMVAGSANWRSESEASPVAAGRAFPFVVGSGDRLEVAHQYAPRKPERPIMSFRSRKARLREDIGHLEIRFRWHANVHISGNPSRQLIRSNRRIN